MASRRVPALLDAGADVLLVSPKAAASLEDLAAAGRIRWAARVYQAGDCAGQSGNGNCGHEYGTDLTSDDRAALLEFLKQY